MNRKREQHLFVIAFLSPAFMLFTIFVAIPGIRSLIYSLQRWDGLSTPQWVGLRNFKLVLRDGDLFQQAVLHNLFLTITPGALTIGLALFFAAAIHRRVRGTNVFRVAFFFPNVISSVAISLLWILLYSATSFGVFNGFLLWLQHEMQSLGVTWFPVELPFPFITSKYVIYSIVPMLVWTATGFYMVLFLAAMENIPESLYEAARLDGATEWTQFWRITLPLIREVLSVSVVFFVISSLKLFDAIWIMENQWPTRESHVMATLLYQKVFSEYNVGYGSAVAVLLFVLIFFATLISLRLSRREALEY